ncbi:uncharacterized protein ACLA_011770 [Aspergillus clavatus NRRL 1]|uniref:DUF8035 domain-containing protein n=1 Tax=Aspergillus clavatus (strain ATCC 1007 / CBS 513.65 / DSM 816 / NCTC 3887 / NRRL 1 / QM 1276 / 107) TaxID=344612 RepID=A1CAI2_ASPCL|nr:uncharacterized protein ACLA_011770 [Aspergillus clavatus NRRL 1]EAW12750.1 conserved hypothetical protein [Aspergillus clavatus NRRL 1]
MDPSVRYRPGSPSGHRMVDPMRASTGTVPLSSSYGLYESSASRLGYTGYPSDVPYMGGYTPRMSHEPRLEVQPISSTTYRDPGHSTKLRTEYAIRPRPRSSTTSAADTHHSPARLGVPSPVSRHSPVVATSHRRSPSPLPNHGPYLVPASSSRHGRHHSRYYPMDYASDTGRIEPHDRRMKIRMSHGGHRDYDHGHRPRYPAPGGFRKGEDIDDYDAYSYTNPREQFEKESVARLNHGRSAYSSRERPLSLTGPDDPQLLPRKDPRALGPPPSHRGFDKVDRDARSRQSGYGSVGSDVDQREPRRMSWQQRRPVSVHQDYEDGHLPHRDDYEGRHHNTRSRRHDDDQSSRKSYEERVPKRLTSSADSVAAAPATGLGTAVLATGYGDDLDYDLTPRSDRHRSHDHGHDHHDHDRHRRRHRSRRPSRRRTESESDGYTSDEDLKNYRREPSAVRRRPGASDSSSTGSKDQELQHLTVERAHRRRSSHSRHRGENGSSRRETSSRGSGSSQEDLKQTPQKDSDVPPKGILKKPREKFPEEPNPIREGVAPLKDAGKKGIPPGARWTKIDRRLVNPAALEAGNERYEERPEYVIVLRVLSKEEIQAYAVKTQEIRDARYQEYLRERRKRREEDRLHGRRDGSSSDDEDEDDEPPRRLEGPTAAGQLTAEPNRA